MANRIKAKLSALFSPRKKLKQARESKEAKAKDQAPVTQAPATPTRENTFSYYITPPPQQSSQRRQPAHESTTPTTTPPGGPHGFDYGYGQGHGHGHGHGPARIDRRHFRSDSGNHIVPYSQASPAERRLARERREATVESEAAREELFRYGIDVRDFQNESDAGAGVAAAAKKLESPANDNKEGGMTTKEKLRQMMMENDADEDAIATSSDEEGSKEDVFAAGPRSESKA